MNIKSVLRALRTPLAVKWWVSATLLPKMNIFLRIRLGDKVLQESQLGKIALFHIGRSGSTVLGDILGQDKKIFWDGEILKEYISGQEPSRLSSIMKYINNREKLSGAERFYGCEIKPFHVLKSNLTLDELICGLEKLGFTHFVVLERRNYLRKIVSSLIAKNTDRWHNSSYEKSIKSTIVINPDVIEIDESVSNLKEALDRYYAVFAMLKETLSSRNLLWLTYEEDLSTSPELAYRKICDFINKDHCKVKTRYARTNPYPLEELIENYADIKRLLDGTRYEWMLSE